jgi:hypothetical protein
MDDCGALRDCRYLLHDRDTKFTRSFRAIIASGRVKPLALPARSPNRPVQFFDPTRFLVCTGYHQL